MSAFTPCSVPTQEDSLLSCLEKTSVLLQLIVGSQMQELEQGQGQHGEELWAMAASQYSTPIPQIFAFFPLVSGVLQG